jgi:hypothetical protein
MDWFDNLPSGIRLVLQSNDMIHDDHVFNFENLENFIQTFPMFKIEFQGQKQFQYPSWSFTRFMAIGYKY